jgi:hypothetical protein
VDGPVVHVGEGEEWSNATFLPIQELMFTSLSSLTASLKPTVWLRTTARFWSGLGKMGTIE